MVSRCLTMCARRKPPSPDPLNRRDVSKPEPSANGKLSGPSHASEQENYNLLSPKSPEYDDFDDNKSGELDRRYDKFHCCRVPIVTVKL